MHEVLDLQTAPAGVDVVLRKENDQQLALGDDREQIVTEQITGFQLVINENPLAIDVGSFIEVRRQRRDPADRARRSERNAVVGMRIADEYVIPVSSRHQCPRILVHLIFGVAHHLA